MALTALVTSTVSFLVDGLAGNTSGVGQDGIGTTGDHKDGNSILSTNEPFPPPSSWSDGDVTEGSSEAEKIAVKVMLVVFSVFGTFGNGLVLYVFTRKSDKVTSTIFILALAWTDFMTCLVIMPFTTANIQLKTKFRIDFFCKLYHFLITCNVPLSAFIMVAIAVDRYFSICHPFLHAVTPRRARISILCLVGFAFCLGTITACMYGVYNFDIRNETVTAGSADWCPNLTTAAPPTGNIGKQENAYPVLESSTIVSSGVVHDIHIIINNGHYGQSSLSRNTSALESPLWNAEQNCTRVVKAIVYNKDGACDFNEILIEEKIVNVYQKIYISFYIISLVVVFTLYFFIYRSVVRRREWRRKQKSFSHAPMSMASGVDNGRHIVKETCATEMELNPKGSSPEDAGEGEDKEIGDKNNGQRQENGMETKELSSSAEKKSSRERRDFNFLANIRTAMMLFVVAVVFIISFLPAWLMATNLMNFNIVVFYSHFIYNVANPVIYAFMNQAFRKELKRVFQRGTHFLRNG